VKKSDLRILEKIFAEEINGSLYYGKAKRLEWLDENGYIEKVKFVLRGHPSVSVEGWALTHKGRIEYCESCRGLEDGA
jgi:hypothetical protein